MALPSCYDRADLLSVCHLNNAPVPCRRGPLAGQTVPTHAGVILAVQDLYGDDVIHFPGCVTWAKVVQ